MLTLNKVRAQLKVTPAHDFNDYEIGKRNNLEIINIYSLKMEKLMNKAPNEFIGSR